MKTRIIFFAAAAAIATVSCAKLDTETANQVNGIESFTASVEESATKTELNSENNGLLWITGDEVKIWGTNGAKLYMANSDGATTKLVTTGTAVTGTTLAAYYPYAESISWDGDNKTFSTTFPATQTYNASDIQNGSYPMVSYITEGTDFQFKNVAGIVCVNVKAAYDNIKVQSVKVESTRNLSGAATVAWNEGTPSVSMTGTDDADKAVTLDCSAANTNTGVAISSSTYMPFYIVVPAGTDAANTFKVTVTGTIQNKAYTASQTLTANKSIVIERSKLATISLTASNLVFDLSQQKGFEGQTANCYLVQEPGMYKFPADVKGNGIAPDESKAAKLSGMNNATIFWETVNTTTAPTENSVIASVSYANNYITFSTPKTIKAGNALLAVRDESNNILWSWHIWLPETTVNSYTSNNLTFMDRFLGALTSVYSASDTKDFGLRYMWGCKNPYPAIAKRGLSTKDSDVPMAAFSGTSIERYDGSVFSSLAETNPNYELYSENSISTDYRYRWATSSGKKTLYDPSPVGWKVNNKTEATILSNIIKSASIYNSCGRLIATTPINVWFPYEGWTTTKTGKLQYGGDTCFWVSNRCSGYDSCGKGIYVSIYAGSVNENYGNASYLFDVVCTKDNTEY